MRRNVLPGQRVYCGAICNIDEFGRHRFIELDDSSESYIIDDDGNTHVLSYDSYERKWYWEE